MTTINLGYALGQLERALHAATAHADADARERARARVEQWRRVIEGMSSGSITVGSRTPTDAPAWATLEVVHGGFATGVLAAEGPLLAHEAELASRIGASGRAGIAFHYLSDAGRAELDALLASGCFR